MKRLAYKNPLTKQDKYILISLLFGLMASIALIIDVTKIIIGLPVNNTAVIIEAIILACSIPGMMIGFKKYWLQIQEEGWI